MANSTTAHLAQNTHPFFSGGNISGDVYVASTSYPGGLVPSVSSSDSTTLMARSQRQCVHLYPQTGTGAEMKLPFVWYKDAICLMNPTSANFDYTRNQFNNMGSLMMETVVNLTSTAQPNASPVSVSVYMWAEDVELWGPSSTTIQGGDEFGDSMKPSGVASTVAEAAGKLANVPIIGTYAMATSIAAKAVSSVLRLFGWSNPPIITGVSGVVPKTSFLNPSPLQCFQDDVIALDNKNEVTIDPRTVGLPPKDELLIADFCAKPSLFDRVTWNNADPTYTTLLTMPVAPVYWRANWIANATTGSQPCARVTMTPATYLAQLFTYWRGTMVLHIKVVCSQFHRGRLLVTWDPSPRYSLLAQASQISEVVDLSTADEITFKVPFMGQFGMLRTDQGPVATNSAAKCTFLSWGNRSTTASFTEPTLVSESNGLITVTVLNDLQCGDATANATLVCSTWFEDMKFAVPLPDTASGSGIGIQPSGCVSAIAMGNVVVQGGEQPDGKSVEYEVPTTGNDHIGMLYAGESCPSLRPLLHRTYLHRVLTFITTASNLVYYQFPRFPIPLNSKGLGYADSITGAPNVGTLNTNLVNTTPIAYITACFVGYRGSLVWKVTSNEAYLGKGTYWGFLAKVASGAVYKVPQTLALSAAAVTRARQLSSIFGSFMQGVSASTQSNSGVTSGVFPMYTNYRMLPGNPHAHYWPSNNAGTYESDVYSNDELVFTGVSTTAGTTDYYVSVAAGTDYNVFGFVNVPDIYVPQLL